MGENVTLYEKLGAEVGISKAVEIFYERILGDPELRPFFVNTDMSRLRSHQIAFLSAATGGPNQYDGRDMSAAHTGRGITSHHFDLVVTHLVATLKELGVDDDDIAQVGGALLPLKPAVVEAEDAA
jgi:hemoglobin